MIAADIMKIGIEAFGMLEIISRRYCAFGADSRIERSEKDGERGKTRDLRGILLSFLLQILII
jgi:hypothetical protein